MAQYLHDGAQQGLPFSPYHSEWLAGSNGYGGSAADSFNQQQAILNQTDNAFMENFFNNPDTAMMGDFSLDWSGMEQKLSGGGGTGGGQVDGFEGNRQTIQNPPGTLAPNTNTHYTAHLSRHPEPKLVGNEHVPSSEDEVAASHLFTMSMHGQEGSRAAATFEGTAGASWGTFPSGYPNPHVQEAARSPLNSSGRQSANSYQSQPQNTFSSNHFPTNPTVQEQLMQQYWLQQQQHMQTAARSRHNSLQLDPTALNFLPPDAQMRMTQSAHPFEQSSMRPTAVRFGSDSSFGNRGYNGPTSRVPLEHEKGANLNNIPFAAQAAANGQTHMPTFTPMTQHHSYGHYAMQSRPRTLQNNSTDSSPGTLGGLPLASPASSYTRHSHPFHQMAQRTVEYEDRSEEDSDFDDNNPRKRRRSQADHEEDAEYSPANHVKKLVPKRGAKTARPMKFDASDDEEDEDFNAPVKRRKASINGLPSLGSSESVSPSAVASPTGKAASGGKKKNRNSQARQNLTEDEKRRNHIQSEKTRRDLIKVQYDHLDVLVPALKSGKSGLSRSDVLKEIVAYVESIVDGNDAMESTLDRRSIAAQVHVGGDV